MGSDQVVNPAHYGGEIECIDYIASLGLMEAFCIGSAIKYLHRLARGGKQHPEGVDGFKRDLRKVIRYCELLLERLP